MDENTAALSSPMRSRHVRTSAMLCLSTLVTSLRARRSWMRRYLGGSPGMVFLGTAKMGVLYGLVDGSMTRSWASSRTRSWMKFCCVSGRRNCLTWTGLDEVRSMRCSYAEENPRSVSSRLKTSANSAKRLRYLAAYCGGQLMLSLGSRACCRLRCCAGVGGGGGAFCPGGGCWTGLICARCLSVWACVSQVVSGLEMGYQEDGGGVCGEGDGALDCVNVGSQGAKQVHAGEYLRLQVLDDVHGPGDGGVLQGDGDVGDFGAVEAVGVGAHESGVGGGGTVACGVGGLDSVEEGGVDAGELGSGVDEDAGWRAANADGDVWTVFPAEVVRGRCDRAGGGRAGPRAYSPAGKSCGA